MWKIKNDKKGNEKIVSGDCYYKIQDQKQRINWGTLGMLRVGKKQEGPYK